MHTDKNLLKDFEVNVRIYINEKSIPNILIFNKWNMWWKYEDFILIHRINCLIKDILITKFCNKRYIDNDVLYYSFD